jgi:hypothetical protein
VSIDNDYTDIREAVVKLCSEFPSAYWQGLDDKREYPAEFVKALSDAGYLSVLIPEEFGGSGLPLSAACAILEEIQRSGGNAGACHAQMYTMGTIVRHGSAEQKQKFLPAIASGELRLQAFGVTEPGSGTDTTRITTRAVREGEHYVVSGLTVKTIRTMMNHATTELFFDQLRVPTENLIGEEGRGFHYIMDGMNAESILIASECIGDARWFIDKASDLAARPTWPSCWPQRRLGRRRIPAYRHMVDMAKEAMSPGVPWMVVSGAR